jgi:hypothetical protein
MAQRKTDTSVCQNFFGSLSSVLCPFQKRSVERLLSVESEI